jgi:molecular chaperone HtpG
MDNYKELIPEYLNFLKGFIDSDGLPLIISHEQLQQNQIIKMIMKNIIKKTLKLFNIIAEKKEDFKTFHKQFSKKTKLLFL